MSNENPSTSARSPLRGRDWWLHAFPIVVGAGALAVCSHKILPSLAVMLFLLGSLFFRFSLDRATERLAGTVIVILVIAAIRNSGKWPHDSPIKSFAYGCAIASSLLAAFRLYLRAPEGGRAAALMLNVLCILSCGSVRGGRRYAAIVAIYLFSEWLLQRHLRNAPRFRAISTRTQVLGLLALLGSGAIALGALLALKPVYHALEDRFQHAMDDYFDSKIGLPSNVTLGHMTRLLRSETVILRILGPAPDHLRGAVLDRYEDGQWRRSKELPKQSLMLPAGPPVMTDADQKRVVEIRHFAYSDTRLFLPLGAGSVSTSVGQLEADSMGILRAEKQDDDALPTVWYVPGTTPPFPIVPPSTEDLAIPASIAPRLRLIAEDWTSAAHSPQEQLEAIERRLQTDFTYSIDHDARSRIDPVLHFLTVTRVGHCEYFASAMVLLARSLGIPARVALGYHVSERNPWFDHYVVRQSNAHSWVEAYRDGAWRTMDPTPASEISPNRRHDEEGLRALKEGLQMAFAKAEEALSNMNPLVMAGAAMTGVIVFGLLRRYGAGKRKKVVARPDAAFEPPDALYTQLERALAKAGHGRRRGETISAWASRLDGLFGNRGPSNALRAYADARYSGGTLDELRTLLQQAVSTARSLR